NAIRKNLDAGRDMDTLFRYRGYAAVMLSACCPLGPCAISKETRWPSFSVLNPFIWIEEKWAKRSSPPPSGVIKPNPLASLNHLTVPVCLLPLSSGTGVSVVSDILTASAQDFTNPRQQADDGLLPKRY